MKILIGLFAFLVLLAAPAEASYYDSFVFRTEGTCRQSDRLWFRQSSTWHRVDLGRDHHGRRKVADITLQLFPDHKFWMHYSEVVITRYLPNGGTEGIEVYRAQRQGTWALEGRNLVLPGFLTAVPVRIHDHGGIANGFHARFAAPIGDPDLVRAEVVFGSVHSKVGPRGLSVAQYCRP